MRIYPNGPVQLRALESTDVERTHAWHNDPTLYDTLTSAFRWVSRGAEEEWLHKKGAYATDQVNLAICLREDSRHIGNIYLSNIDWVCRHAELALLIGEVEHRGRGYGQAALRLLIEHASSDLGLQRLYLFVLADNAAAVRVYEKCDFQKEGILRRHAFKNGAFHDIAVMGLCVGKD